VSTAVILTHGGAASRAEDADGCHAAAERGAQVLARGGDALDAALEATAVLEDDERFNAGTGSNLRLDGALVQMDAAVMTSDARFGAVGCIEDVKNPILVAAQVMKTPHIMLVGEGATAFARRMGFVAYDPRTARARLKHARALAELQGRGDGAYADDAIHWRGFGLEQAWNFDEPFFESGDTVGAVVRDHRGHFAATASTGGTLYMLRGRVGDSPLIGCGVFAGPAGAVAATGVGEEIARRVLCKTVYDWLAAGMSASEAAARAIALFDSAIDVGLLCASASEHAIASNRSMASAAISRGSASPAGT
jgi:isoaspartyl peptidase/L-asparaginase-like protein (Ntn-hydrolase superfamily)